MKTTTNRWSFKTAAVLLAAAFLSFAGSMEAATPKAQPKSKPAQQQPAPSQQSQSSQAQPAKAALPSSQVQPAELFTAQLISKADAEKAAAAAVVSPQSAIVPPPSPNLITATAYPFTSAAAVALENMSSGTTQLVAPDQDDTVSAVTNIGFDFWYDGVRFTQFSVNANGEARLGGTAIGTTFTNTLASVTDAPKIAPYWDDLWVGNNGKVHFKVIGSAPTRKFIVEWLNEQVPRVGAATAGAATFQMWLFESSGLIEFVYGSGMAVNSANSGYSVGLQSGVATNFASVTTLTSTASYAAANDTQSDAITAGTAYLFTPNVPTAPTGLNFTSVGSGAMTLNWTDTSSNEVGFAIYRSTDGGTTFTFVAQTAANANSFIASGLTPTTTYTWKVQAVTEGGVSTALTGSQATIAAGTRTSTAVGGLWSATGTWVGGIVPSSADNAVIANGATVTIDTAAACLNLTVGQGTSGILQYDDSGVVRSLAVGNTATISAGAIFRANPTPTLTAANTFSVGQDLINNGTMACNFVAAGTSTVGITFTGANNAAWTPGAASSTDLATVTLNKGTSNANTLTFTPAGTITVLGANTSGFLTITNGTFKISGSGTFSNPVFAIAAYAIPGTGGFWLNNANYTVVGQNGNSTMNGLLRLTAGIFNEGTVSGNAMTGSANTVSVIVEGATMNIASRFAISSAFPASFNMSSGTINVTTVGSTAAVGFGFTSASLFTMSGGTINLVQASTVSPDYQVSSTPFISGGTLNVGTAATTAASLFRIQGQMPNVVIDNTTNTKTANLSAQMNVWQNLTITTGSTLNLNAQALLQIGPTITNNGAIVVTTNNTGTVVYGGNLQLTAVGGVGTPQTYSGTGTFGSAALAVATLQLQNGGNLTLTAGVSALNANRVNLLFGNITGSGAIALGNGAASTEIVQRGVTSNVLPAGAFDVAPVFNIGTGGLIEVSMRHRPGSSTPALRFLLRGPFLACRLLTRSVGSR